MEAEEKILLAVLFIIGVAIIFCVILIAGQIHKLRLYKKYGIKSKGMIYNSETGKIEKS